MLFYLNDNKYVVHRDNLSQARQAFVLGSRKIRTIDAMLSAPVGIFNRETPCEPRKSRQRSSAFPLVAAHECAFKESASTRRSALALRRVTDTGGFSENKALPAVRVYLLYARVCVDVVTSLCTRLKSRLKQSDRRFMKSFTDLIKLKVMLSILHYVIVFIRK